jgi:hypothetical protein
MSSSSDTTNLVLTDNWTVPKLLGLVVLVLSLFFIFIYSISP